MQDFKKLITVFVGHQAFPFSELRFVHFLNTFPLYLNGNLQYSPFNVLQAEIKLFPGLMKSELKTVY